MMLNDPKCWFNDVGISLGHVRMLTGNIWEHSGIIYIINDIQGIQFGCESSSYTLNGHENRERIVINHLTLGYPIFRPVEDRICVP